MFEIISLSAIIVLTLPFYVLFRKSGISVKNNLFSISVKLVVLVTGAVIVYLNIIEFDLYLQRKNWPRVSGQVTSFDIVGIKTREPEISYRFSVNEKFYQGKTNLDTPLFGSRKYQEQTARTISGNYQVGDSVMVYYNPGNPAESVLIIHPGWSVYIQLTFGIFIIAMVLALMIPAKSKEGQK
jgi:Protein of unknown function (DUF3592)